jgi:signal peptidase
MRSRELATAAATLALVVVVLLLVAGQLLGQPLLLGYVTSGSMEPTLSAGDGFVAVPSFLAGDPAPGDVVVFEAETVQGGGLTTHRVVGETEQGYVTKGDANPITDQDGGEPYVTEDRIVAHALRVNGGVVAIPLLGTVVTGVRAVVAAPFGLVGTENVGTVLVFVGMLLFVLAGATGGRSVRKTQRSTSRENVVRIWAVVLLAAAVVTMAATAAMLVPADTYEIDLVTSDEPTEDPQVVAPGERAEVSYDVHNGGVVPVLVVSEPLDEGVTVEPERTVLGFGDRSTVTVRMDAPGETGEYARAVRESRYLLVLPRRLILALHSVHPLMALFAVDVVVAAFVVTVAVGVFGTGYLRMRSGADVPLRVRVERRVRGWL